MREVTQVIERDALQRKAYCSALHKSLVELEMANRRQRRIWINEQSVRLGRLQTGRHGSRVGEYWEEGDAFRRIN